MSLQPLSELPRHPLKIRRALLSVSDKDGIVPLAKALHRHGVELVSTGGTANTIREAGIPVRDVAEVTGSPEILDGRVKTLHPAIHGGILARTSHQPDLDELNRQGIDPIELVVVNLYPFQQAVAEPNITPATATEFIDIGGPTMVRAAAKNFAHVGILTSPGQYGTAIEELDANNGALLFKTRRRFAAAAFAHTAAYDAAISRYFESMEGRDLPKQLSISLPRSGDLRYGENPHQMASVYGHQSNFIDCFHGKELSYNNYIDIDAALQLMSDFRDSGPAAAIFKHTVPCGVAQGDTVADAYKRAFATDTNSPFGGIIIASKEIDLDAARAMDAIFTEIILAPSFHPDAEDLLTEKKNRRLVRILQFPEAGTDLNVRSIFGGMVAQQPNRLTINPDTLQVVTERKPTDTEMNDLLFGWTVVKHVKSNAIVYAKGGQTLGIGTGQTSRVGSSELAVANAQKEGLSLSESIIASDAFFPFADGVEAAAEAGATAVIQPGGSVRDQDVIDAANRLGLAMVFTGIRHFRH